MLGWVNIDFEEVDKIVHHTFDRDDFGYRMSTQLVIPRLLFSFSYAKQQPGRIAQTFAAAQVGHR